MKREQSSIKNIAVSLIALFLAAGFTTTTSAQKAIELSDEALTQLAGEVFTFAYPLMEQYRMMVALTHPQSPAFSADFNQFAAGRALQGPEDTLERQLASVTHATTE